LKGHVFAGTRIICWITALALLLAATAAGASVDSELAFHRGVLAYGDERLDDARQDFERVLAEDPEDTAAIHYLALIAQAQGSPDQAIALYERALALEPDDVDLRFDLGSALLEAGREAEARQAFEQVIAAEPDRARAHLFAGIAAYRLGDYDAAVPYLDRAAELDPSERLYARYYAGLSEAMRGELGSAAGAFDDVTEASPAHPLSRSAGTLRERVDPSAPERRWNLALMAGLEWDSNPTLSGDDDLLDAAGRESDGKGVYRVRGGLRLFEDERVSLDAGYDAFFSTHFEEDEVDLQTHVGWAAGSLDLDPVRLSLRYDYAFTALDMSENFRSLHRVAPSVLVREGGLGLLHTFFQYQHLAFFSQPQDALDRDGHQYAVGMNQFFFLPAPFRYLRIGALGDFLQTEGSEFDYDAFEINAGFAAVLPLEVELTALYRFIERNFRNDSIFPRRAGGGTPSTERDDPIHRLTVELARSFGDHWELAVSGSFRFQDSQVAIYDHNRHVVGSYLTYRF
jgi:tetratricopeptide (TPR) repeat protein